jgi:hypothetical protein
LADIKRMNYFDQQFLVVGDFIAEQTYHREMRLLHNRSLHTCGVAKGLDVTLSGAREVMISAGVAIDNQGREIALGGNTSYTLTNDPAGGPLLITISYDDQETDPYSSLPGKNTRIRETFSITDIPEQSAVPDTPAVTLARVKLDAQENIEIDTSARRWAGPLSDETSEVEITLRRLRLGSRSIPNSQWPSLKASGADQLTVGGSLFAQSLGAVGDITLNGSLRAGGDLSGRNLSVTGDLSGRNLSVTGDLSGRNLSVTGDLSGRNLNVTGALSAPNATINGALSVGGSLVIGSVNNPQAKLQVLAGAIVPSVGKSPQAGIQFPPNPGGGSGDEAFIRYFVTAGETTRLQIGIGNDLDDSIGLVQAGAERLTVVNGRIGIGTMTPTYALDVSSNGGIKLGLEGNGGGRLILANNAGDNKIYLEAFSADGNGSAAELLITGKNVDPIPIIKLVATATSTSGNFTVNGSAFKPGGGSWGNSSDLRLKRKIEPLTGALEKLLQLRGVCFEWVEPEKMGNQHGLQRGLIAQEVESVFPEWISADADGYKLLSIIGFEALMIEALRELKSEIESLKSQPVELAGKRPSPGERKNR